jgi:hypothetical protein
MVLSREIKTRVGLIGEPKRVGQGVGKLQKTVNHLPVEPQDSSADIGTHDQAKFICALLNGDAWPQVLGE